MLFRICISIIFILFLLYLNYAYITIPIFLLLNYIDYNYKNSRLNFLKENYNSEELEQLKSITFHTI